MVYLYPLVVGVCASLSRLQGSQGLGRQAGQGRDVSQLLSHLRLRDAHLSA